MSLITFIEAREILDSRGNPTIEVTVLTESGARGTASVPSGASTGINEALELRDKGTEFEKNWYGGKGVMRAVNNVNDIIAPMLETNFSVFDQRGIDAIMISLDGTSTKSKLGANAILGVSLACAKAAANELSIPLYKYLGGTNAHILPMPMLNVMNGGAHASNTIDFQEFMIVPIGAKNFKEALQMANKVFHNLAKILKNDGYGTQVGDEGGFAPNCKSHEEVLDYLVRAIKQAEFKPSINGKNAIAIALDAAASEFYNEKTKTYTFKKLKKAIENKAIDFEDLKSTKLEFTTDEIIDYYGQLVKKYPIISIEDGLAETDWEGFAKFTSKFGKQIQIVGDDLTVTNPKLLKKAIEQKAMNSILIKLNQIGTLTETLDTIQMAQKAAFSAIISHRSGETEDTTIADLAVALNTGQIKTGSLSRTDRIAKYNRLLEIEEELGDTSIFLGRETFYNIN